MIILPILLFSLGALAYGPPSSRQCETARYENRPRVFVCTDMSNEPDDQMSFVRFLTYSNELDIQGVAAVTSVWLNDTTDAPTIRKVAQAYGNVTNNLSANVPASARYPQDIPIYEGHKVYGLEALKLAPSNAALALIKAADASTTDKPLWVTLWGGAAVLAEALNHVEQTRGQSSATKFAQNLRVYSISDQDDAGAWIRQRYPQLFYIVSLHGFSEYTQATWNGISGELWRHFDKGGPDTTLVTNEWLQRIRIGPLGHYYLNFSIIMEGDTPSFLPLIQNGLGDPEHPEWGNWGGRYILMDMSGAHRVFSNAADFVIGKSGDTYLSSFASIWRWRQAYQYDFAARMAWSVNGDYKSNNHHPIAIVNGTCGPKVMTVNYKFGNKVVLDARESWDPDGDSLRFGWLHYREVVQRLEGPIDRVSHNITIVNLTKSGSLVSLEPKDNITMHIVLSVEDDRDMSLTTYRRIILEPSA
ncbi:DUF1593-domain-containing protein [Rhizodiscina lignyota]|uniref:DUF1593-domain-containing protein n=1 Tax=Rhizodiscina lignyota TaxID=1504668 RepID=A0A9P4MG27_9PEZI|nr:DUF1593-domain-containing protein [Rhizodiscina lignyota]